MRPADRQINAWLNDLDGRSARTKSDLYIHIANSYWPTIKNSVETDDDFTVPAGHQMLVWENFIFDGGSLTLEGELVILGGDIRGGGPSAYVSKDANYTITPDDHTVVATVTGLIFTLPTAVGLKGKEYILKLNVVGDLTIDGYGSETIDDGATAVLNVQYESITIISNGTNWRIV